MKTLAEILEARPEFAAKTIEKIYHGKDNWCRCGCGGNYFYSEETGFRRALNRLNKGIETSGVRYETHYGDSWINIPDDTQENKCYCIYFK